MPDPETRAAATFAKLRTAIADWTALTFERARIARLNGAELPPVWADSVRSLHTALGDCTAAIATDAGALGELEHAA